MSIPKDAFLRAQSELISFEEVCKQLPKVTEEFRRLLNEKNILEIKKDALAKKAKTNQKIVDTYEKQQQELSELRSLIRYAEKCRTFLKGLESYSDPRVYLPDNAPDIEALFEEYPLEDKDLDVWLDSKSDIEVIALAHILHATNNMPGPNGLDITLCDTEGMRGVENCDYVDEGWLKDKRPDVNLDLCDSKGCDPLIIWSIEFKGKKIETMESFYDSIWKFKNNFWFSIDSSDEDIYVDQVDTVGYY